MKRIWQRRRQREDELGGAVEGAPVLEDGATAAQVSLSSASAPEWSATGADGALAATPSQSAAPAPRPDAGGGVPAGPRLRGAVEAYLKDLLAQETKIPRHAIDARKPLDRYGVDSVVVAAVTDRLEQVLGELPRTLFFEYETIAALAEHLAQAYSSTWAAALQIDRGATTARPLPPVNRGEGRVEADPPGAVGTPAGAEAEATELSAGSSQRRVWQRLGGTPVGRAPAEPSESPIAIIGLHGRYPEADDLEQFWDNLARGRDCIREVPADRWDGAQIFDPQKNRIGKSYSKWGGFLAHVDRFDHQFFDIAKAEADYLDPQERIWLETTWHTFEDAGYSPTTLEQTRVGLFVGVMSNMYQKLEVPVGEASIAPVASYASIANRVSYQLNLRGPSMAVDTMCSSSLTALHLACAAIRRGECEMALAGGVNVIVHPHKYVMLSLNGFLSTDGRCRSFGENGDGYVPGEGVGAVLLKPLDQAEADGDRIYGLVRGTAVNHGGRTNGYTVPSVNAQADLIDAALSDARVNPQAISYVEAHGTGTALGDPIEIRALAKAFERHGAERQYCALGSVKSNIGHLESAAGIAGLTKVLLQLQHREIVPSLHGETLNPQIDFARSPVTLQRTLVPWPVDGDNAPRLAAISGFGAGGSNAHVIVEEYRARAEGEKTLQGPNMADACGPQLVLLSARSEERLRVYVERFIEFLQGETAGGIDGIGLRDVAYTTQVGRVALEERIAVVAGSLEDLLAQLQAFQHGRPSAAVSRGQATGAGLATALCDGPEGAEIVSLFLTHGNLPKLGQLWALGLDVDWRALHRGDRPRRVRLPRYPFAPTRCWVPRPSEQTAQVGAVAARVNTAEHDPRVRDEVERVLTDAIAEVSPLPREALQRDRLLFGDLYLDSIMVAQLSARVMSAFTGVELTEELFSEDLTIAQLADHVARQRLQASGTQTAPGPAQAEHATAAAAISSRDDVVSLSLAVEPTELSPAEEARRRWEELLQASGGSVALQPLEGPNGPLVAQGERQVVNFTSGDYLGLAADPRVRAAASEAAGEYGTSASASRPVAGEIPLHRQLEAQLSEFIGSESAVLFVSGHATNVTTIEYLLGRGDLMLFDEGSRQSSIVEGALVSGAEVMAFPHRDYDALERTLEAVRQRYRKVLIATEGAFAGSGALADLPRLVALKRAFRTLLLIDEDNSFGVVGHTGRGLCEHFEVDPRDIDAISAGLNKALGSCGGFVAGDRGLVDYIKNNSTSLIFAVSIAPMSTAAALEALKLLRLEPERPERARERARELARALGAADFEVQPTESAVVGLDVPPGQSGALWARELLGEGVVSAYRSAGELGCERARLLLATTAAHDGEQIDAVVGGLATVRAKLAADPIASAQASELYELERLIAADLEQRSRQTASDISELQADGKAYEGEVPPVFFRPAEFPEYKQMVRRLQAVSEEDFLYFKPHEGIVNDTICVGGRRNVNFSSFNYLGLSGNPEVIAAAQRAIERYGTSASSERRFSGTLAVHCELEQELAAFIGTEDALVFDAGHNTNVSTVGHLFGPGDLVLHDELSHNSLVQGALLSGADRQPFPHNDYERADEILARTRMRYRRAVVVVEGIYSQDGDLPDLNAFLRLKERHRALLFVDEAHSIGVIGQTGRGIAEQFGVEPARVDVLMGTISKALGTSGGYISGSRALIETLREAPCIRNGVSVSAPIAGAALEAIRVLRRQPEKVATLHARARLFLQLAREQGLDTGLSKGSGIVPIMAYSDELAYAMTYALRDRGVIVHPFTYPIVPKGKARLRFFVTADHTEQQIRDTVEELGRVQRAQGEQRPEPSKANGRGAWENRDFAPVS